MMSLKRIHVLGMLAYCCISILSSCTRAEVVYLQEAKGLVEINLDYSGYTLPDVEYYFYNTVDQTGYILGSTAGSIDDRGNFRGLLPAGIYRVIATNTSAANVEFTGMDSYGTFIVKAGRPSDSRQFISRADDYTMLLQPDSVYSIVVKELIVMGNDTVRKETLPTLLTKRLDLEFTMDARLGDTEVESMTGILSGIYPAVHLYTCEGWQIEESPGRAVNFETVVEESYKRKAQILLFGVRNPDPADGDGYPNMLELTLKMKKNGTIFTIKRDITQLLSEALKKNGGTIPSSPIPIEIIIPIEVDAEVDDWIQEGEDKKET